MATRLQSPSPSPPRQFLGLFLLFTLLHISISSSSPISFQLHHTPPRPSPLTTTATTGTRPLPDPYKALAALATASLLRARHLKNRTTSSHHHPELPSNTAAAARPRSEAPLSPHSYGAYAVTLSFGTPPQPIPLVFDTGSDLPWVPCTTSYACTICPDSDITTTVFLPKESSTARIVGCHNPKCRWIHSQKVLLNECPDCSSVAANCSDDPQVCPPYLVLYGSGSTGGILLTDTLHLSDSADPLASPPDFAVGCSVVSLHQPPAGIAGFGRGPVSFTSQLRLSSFSYCLAPRRFDDVPGKAGSLVLNDDDLNDDVNPTNAGEGRNHSSPWSSTPFLQNPASNNSDASSERRTPFGVYYYVGLRGIFVGGRKLEVPHQLLETSPQEGDGGTIIDSGSTFTYMDSRIVRILVQAFQDAVAGRYSRSEEVELTTGLSLCYDVSSASQTLQLPELELRFKGGATMALPLENYFAVIGGTDDSDAAKAVCLMIVSDDDDDDDDGSTNEPASGPSIILGAFQQQNYRMFFDLNSNKLRFRSQRCLAAATA